MAARSKSPSNGTNTSTATIGFEAKLWLTADKLRNNMDAAEYSRAERGRSPKATRRAGAEASVNHAVLGLIFLKYISDTFEEHRAKLLAGQGDYAGANAEDPDEPSGARQPAAGSPKGQRGGAEQYKAENVFWVPAEARWSHLQGSAKLPTIGKTVDDAMVAIERDNPRLKGVLPKDYARPGLDTARRDSALSTREATPQSLSAARDNQRLGELIDLIATISLTAASEGEKPHRSVDLLGRVYDWSGATKTAAGSPKGERGGAHQYFLTRFASAEGKNGGQFYIPSCVVRCLVEMLAPYTALRGSAFRQSEASPQVVSAAKDNGRIYDPACGSGGSLPAFRLRRVRSAHSGRAIAPRGVQSEKFVESHGGKLGDISIYGQDKWARRQRPFGLAKRARRVRLRGQQPKQSNATTRRLAIMNLAIRGIEADIGKEHADTFRSVQHPDLRADYVLANPPFNDSDTALRGSAFLQTGGKLQVMAERHDNFRKDDDVRWQFGVPPKGNANFAWVQHFIHHLAPQGMAGFVLANGSMSSNQSGEGDIRRALIEADLVDCMVALPGQLFYSTQIPVCLWFIEKNGNASAKRSAFKTAQIQYNDAMGKAHSNFQLT